MRLSILIWLLFAIFPVMAQEKVETEKPLMVTAEQAAPVKIANLEAENAQQRVIILRQQLQEAETAAQSKQKAAQDAQGAVLRIVGIKPDDLPQYDVSAMPDGGWVFKKKAAALPEKKP